MPPVWGKVSLVFVFLAVGSVSFFFPWLTAPILETDGETGNLEAVFSESEEAGI